MGSIEALKSAKKVGVNNIVCVGTDVKDSQVAIDFANNNNSVWATVGLHPHDTKQGLTELDKLEPLLNNPKVIAIGECGLDYFYNHSPKSDQIKALRYQIELALSHDLPIIFHVREAFDDFWPVFDEYKSIKGVFHSFSAAQKDLEQILGRGLSVGLNGIVTFSKNPAQLEAAKNVPLDKLLLETDAPFLAPIPLRGQVNQPANIPYIGDFLSKLRGETLEEVAKATTTNFNNLFLSGINKA